MSDLHIGIDPGLKGALVALSPLRGLPPISVLRMPTFTVDGKPQMNTRRIVDWVLEIYPKGDCHIWLEKCPKHAAHAAAMRSMAITYGRLIGIFESRFPHMILHRVACGNELAGWQRQFLGTFKGEESKQKALALARAIWPDHEWETNRNEGVYDGPVDAALVGEWGRRKMAKETLPLWHEGSAAPWPWSPTPPPFPGEESAKPSIFAIEDDPEEPSEVDTPEIQATLQPLSQAGCTDQHST